MIWDGTTATWNASIEILFHDVVVVVPMRAVTATNAATICRCIGRDDELWKSIVILYTGICMDG